MNLYRGAAFLFHPHQTHFLSAQATRSILCEWVEESYFDLNKALLFAKTRLHHVNCVTYQQIPTTSLVGFSLFHTPMNDFIMGVPIYPKVLFVSGLRPKTIFYHLQVFGLYHSDIQDWFSLSEQNI